MAEVDLEMLEATWSDESYIAGQVQVADFGLFLVGVDVWSVGNGSLSRGQKIVAQAPDQNIYGYVKPQRPNIPILLVDGSRY